MSADQYNIDLANRQIEINNWTYNNKMDTLFVFQILFMSILSISILMGFQKVGVIGAAFVWYAFVILVILVAIIIINRTMYANNRRDTRLWNKRRFEGDNQKDSPLTRGDTSYQNYLESVKAKYGDPASSCNCNK
jgi:hypothetical protein